MGRNDFLYNIVSVIFLLLSVMVCLIVLAWTTGTINVPGGLAPSTDVPIPPTNPVITFTPSVTPEPSRTPFATSGPLPLQPTQTAGFQITQAAPASPATDAPITTQEPGS